MRPPGDQSQLLRAWATLNDRLFRDQNLVDTSYKSLGHESSAQQQKLGLLKPFEDETTSNVAEGKRRAEEIAEALRQAAERHRRPWYMLDPEGWPRRAWDLVAYALIWCLVVLVPLWIGFFMQNESCNYVAFDATPLPTDEVGVDPAPHTAGAIMSVINLFFVVDIFLNFFTGVKMGREGLEGELPEYNLAVVARNYARTWLVWDVAACFPLNCIMVRIWPGVNFYNTGTAIWLLRVVSMHRRSYGGVLEWLNNRLDVKRELSSGLKRILNYTSILLVVVHYFACLIWLVIRVQHFPANTWPVLLGLLEETIWQQWLFAYFSVVSAMIGLGYGSYPPTTWPEALVWIFAMIISAAMFSIFNGFILSYIISTSARQAEYKELVDEAVRMLTSRHVPEELQSEVLGFLRAKWEDKQLEGAGRQDRVLRELPRAIRAQVAVMSSGGFLSRLPLFKRNPSLLEDTALLLQRTVAVPGQELVQQGHAQHSVLFIIRGLVDIMADGDLLDTLGPGDIISEAALLPVPRSAAAEGGEDDAARRACLAGGYFKSFTSAVALTRCQLYTLPVDQFRRVLRDYPEVLVELEQKAERYLGRAVRCAMLAQGSSHIGLTHPSASAPAAMRLGKVRAPGPEEEAAAASGAVHPPAWRQVAQRAQRAQRTMRQLRQGPGGGRGHGGLGGGAHVAHPAQAAAAGGGPGGRVRVRGGEGGGSVVFLEDKDEAESKGGGGGGDGSPPGSGGRGGAGGGAGGGGGEGWGGEQRIDMQ